MPFDFFGNGTKPLLDWIAPSSGFLALVDGNDQITSAAQLFGTQTQLKDGTLAGDGFAALAQYDDNGDGVIDQSDLIFNKLVVWFDRNSDGASQADEIVSVKSLGVRSLHLGFVEVDQPDPMKTGHVGLEGTFDYVNANGAVVSAELADVYFKMNPEVAP